MIRRTTSLMVVFASGFSSPAPDNLSMEQADQFPWMAIVRDDFLLEGNRKLDAPKPGGVKYSYQETDGAHDWRRHRAEVVPLLLR